MSVDPFIQSPTDSQSVNPYSYIMNNPLAGTDPTGLTSEDANAKETTEPTRKRYDNCNGMLGSRRSCTDRETGALLVVSGQENNAKGSSNSDKGDVGKNSGTNQANNATAGTNPTVDAGGLVKAGIWIGKQAAELKRILIVSPLGAIVTGLTPTMMGNGELPDAWLNENAEGSDSDATEETETIRQPPKGKRRKNRIPDRGDPGTVASNGPGTTKKKYGQDGWVEKEWNQGHGPGYPDEEVEDHIHDHIPNPYHPKGKPKRQPGRPPTQQDLDDFGF